MIFPQKTIDGYKDKFNIIIYKMMIGKSSKIETEIDEFIKKIINETTIAMLEQEMLRLESHKKRIEENYEDEVIEGRKS